MWISLSNAGSGQPADKRSTERQADVSKTRVQRRRTMDDDESEYKVGFGKPPKQKQFVKGQSGNPKGRPKGSRNMQSILSEVFSKIVPFYGEGAARRVC